MRLTFENGDNYELSDETSIDISSKSNGMPDTEYLYKSFTMMLKVPTDGLSRLALFLKVSQSIDANLDNKGTCKVTIDGLDEPIRLFNFRATYSFKDKKEEDLKLTGGIYDEKTVNTVRESRMKR